MPIQRVTINSRDPNTIVLEESFFLAVADGAVALGDVVNFRTDATGDGKRVEQPATDNLSCFAGVCDDTSVADTKVVKLQSMGYRAKGAEVIGHADLSAGDKLITANGVDHFTYGAAGDGYPAFAIFCGAAYTNVTTTATKPVFLFGIS
jgi:hypothetical protein